MLSLTGQDIVSCGVTGAKFGGVLMATTLLRGRLTTTLARSALRRTVPSSLRRGAPPT